MTGRDIDNSPDDAISRTPGTGLLGVVLLQMGGPRDLTGIEPFLKALFSDPAMVRLPFFMRPWQGRLAARWAHKRAPGVEERYRRIGGGSPLVEHTDQLARNLETRLRTGGLEAVVRGAHRYCQPDVATALDELERLGVDRLGLLPLYPHFSHTTTGSSLAAAKAALNGQPSQWPVTILDDWGAEAGYLDLLEAQVRAALSMGEGSLPDRGEGPGDETPTALLCSAHGLPRRYIEAGDPYLEQVTATFRALGQRLEPLECRLGFQSQLGPVKWLEPTSSQVISQLAREGYRKLLVLPLGFVCDHLETLYDMDVVLRERAQAEGFESFRRLPAFNDHPGFVELLANLITGRLESEMKTRNDDDP